MKQYTVMAETGYAANADTLLYTCPDGQSGIVDYCHSYSTAGGTLTLYVVPPGGSVGAANVMFVKSHTALESYSWPEMVGAEFVAGTKIYEKAVAATTVSRRITGRVGS